jgi:hypothetical protein
LVAAPQLSLVASDATSDVAARPRLSLVIPTYSEAPHLEALITELDDLLGEALGDR